VGFRRSLVINTEQSGTPMRTLRPIAAPRYPAASFVAFAPPADLAPFVEYLWQFTVATPASSQVLVRVVPGGHVDVAYGSGDFAPAPTVRGPDSLVDGAAQLCPVATSVQTIPVGPTTVTGTRFRLGTNARVVRAALTRLMRERHAALSLDPIETALQMTRRLVSTGELAQPFDPRVRHAAMLLDRAATTARSVAGSLVEDVARTVATTSRTLERLFREHIGVAPRTFLRLRRVCVVAARLEAPITFLASHPERPTLSHLAHHAGFSDHAHLTRDFRRTMGVTPSEYAREARERPILREWKGVRPELITPLGTVIDPARWARAAA
jgi:AraC-like DNA-binding protein